MTDYYDIFISQRQMIQNNNDNKITDELLLYEIIIEIIFLLLFLLQAKKKKKCKFGFRCDMHFTFHQLKEFTFEHFIHSFLNIVV